MSARQVWVVTEFWGTGDPMFGGQADDRSLGWNGEFLRGSYYTSAVAEFSSHEAAMAAGKRAAAREGSKLGAWARTSHHGGVMALLDAPERPWRITPMALGDTLDIAAQMARWAYMGADASMRGSALARMRYKPVTPDEASELAEWWDAPWDRLVAP
jgi:hypothetical protein